MSLFLRHSLHIVFVISSTRSFRRPVVAPLENRYARRQRRCSLDFSGRSTSDCGSTGMFSQYQIISSFRSVATGVIRDRSVLIDACLVTDATPFWDLRRGNPLCLESADSPRIGRPDIVLVHVLHSCYRVVSDED